MEVYGYASRQHLIKHASCIVVCGAMVTEGGHGRSGLDSRCIK